MGVKWQYKSREGRRTLLEREVDVAVCWTGAGWEFCLFGPVFLSFTCFFLLLVVFASALMAVVCVSIRERKIGC